MARDLAPVPPSIAADMVSTTFEIHGCKVVRTFGIVRGVTVRSRSIVGNFVAYGTAVAVAPAS